MKSSLNTINKSIFKNYTLNLEATYLSKNEVAYSFENYISNYEKLNDLNLNFVNYLDENQILNINGLWVICMFDLNGQNCSLPKKLKNFKIIDEFFYNSINLKIIEKK